MKIVILTIVKFVDDAGNVIREDGPTMVETDVPTMEVVPPYNPDARYQAGSTVLFSGNRYDCMATRPIMGVSPAESLAHWRRQGSSAPEAAKMPDPAKPLPATETQEPQYIPGAPRTAPPPVVLKLGDDMDISDPLIASMLASTRPSTSPAPIPDPGSIHSTRRGPATPDVAPRVAEGEAMSDFAGTQFDDEVSFLHPSVQRMG